MELYKFHIVIKDFRSRRNILRAWKSFLFIGLGLVLVVWGCDDEKGTERWIGDPAPLSITLSIATDTLRFLPGDSVSTAITIIATDLQGSVLQWQRVYLSLSEPELGFITYLDTLLRDTTNALGRVSMQFTSIGIEGDEIFTATARGISAKRELAIRAIPTVIEVNFPFYHYPANADSIDFKVWYYTAAGIAIIGNQLFSSATLGIQTEVTPTNETGLATGILYRTNEYGIIYVTVSDGFTISTDSISIVSLNE